jgi:tetratricopeptide (TPR) repeat protein
MLRRAAEAGNTEAAVVLAEMLEEDGDLSGAEHWNRVAATAGDMDGAVHLGILLYEKGKREEAVEWLKAAATSDDPDFTNTVGAMGALGQVLLVLNNLDESEYWLRKAVAAGSEASKQDLAELERVRSRTQGGAGQGSPDEVMQTFKVSSVIFYDGSGHRLGRCSCTLTRTAFLIDDARGGISQILIRDINGVSTPGRMVSPKLLRITASGVAYDIYCENKAQKELLEDWLVVAIRVSRGL